MATRSDIRSFTTSEISLERSRVGVILSLAAANMVIILDNIR